MSTPNIKKHGFYAYKKGLEKGLGLIVYDISDKVIAGVKLNVGKTEKFSMSRLAFENLLAYNILEFVEVVPKFVWKDMKKTYCA